MKLSRYFQDNMVIQRDKPLVFFGTCGLSEKISIHLEQNGTLLYTSENTFSDHFIFECPSVNNTIDMLEVTFRNKDEQIELNALVGDVFLLSGQSNMAYPFYVIDQYPVIESEYHEKQMVRYLNLGDEAIDTSQFTRAIVPQKEIDSNKYWFSNKAKDLRDAFSGIGVVFAHEYIKKHAVPVGLVNISVGGSSIDSFLPEEIIFNDSKIKDYLIGKGKIDDSKVIELSYTQSAGIFNEKISPLKNIFWKSIFWYQGEHHVGDFNDALYYKHSLKTLIKSFRDFFQDKELSFGAIQIAINYYPQDKGYGCPLINEAIQDAVFESENAFVVPIYDYPVLWKNDRIGDQAMMIHPTNKSELAKRLFQLFESRDKLPYVKDYKTIGSEIHISIENAMQGLQIREGVELQGFTIADQKGNYYKAEATILNGDTVVIKNAHILKPVKFMYAFYLYNHHANLMNSEGLPVLPYRSDHIDIRDDRFLSYHPHFDMTHEFVSELGFLPAIAYPSKKRIFIPGSINCTGEAYLENINQKEIKCYFITRYPGHVNYFGISPNLDLVGTQLRIRVNDLIEVMFTSNVKDIKYLGVLMKTVDNQIVQFPVHTLDTTDNVFSAKVIIDEAFHADLTQVRVDQAFLRTVKDLQFLFETRSNADVLIKKINIYGGTDD